MTAPVPYVLLDGRAREALGRYAEVFGGDVELLEADGRVGHGLLDGPVRLYAADVAPGEPAWRLDGGFLALLGAAEPEVLTRWFEGLAEGGIVEAALELQAWGDHEGRVVDRFGVRWLVGWRG